MKKLLILILLALSCNKESDSQIQREEEATPKSLPSTSYLLNRDKKCFNSQIGDVACTYKVGDLQFTIWGIGAEDSVTVVDKTSGENGEYQIRFANHRTCMLVKPGMKTLDAYKSNDPFTQLAFISPITGRIYEDYLSCEEET